MRIRHVIQSLDPDGGGPPAVALRLASAQAGLGHDVAVVGAARPERRETVDAFIKGVPGIDRVDVRLVEPTGGRLASLFSPPVPGALAGVLPADAAHFHGVWGPDLSGAARLCRSRRVPYFVRPAGMLDYWSLRQKALKKKIALATVTGRMLRGAGAIHALNRHERDAIAALDLGVPIDVIPNGVFLEEVDVPAEPGRFRAHLRANGHAIGDDPFVLFLSRLHFKKGLDLLAPAWAEVASEFPRVRLVVAGPREDDSADAFQREVERAGCAASVRVVGPVYGRDKSAAFRECACFVLPSRQEGFSVAITEALALGAPVVVTRECHFPEVSEVGAGVETSLEPPDIAAGLRAMLGDDDRRARAGEAGSRLVRERFVWPEIARRTLEMYGRAGAPRAAA